MNNGCVAKNGKILLLFLAVLISSQLSLAQSPIPERAKLKKVANGFQFTEGPLWMNGSLIFSDMPANTIYQWRPGKGATVFLKPSGHSNGIALMHDGTLVIARISSDKKIEVITDEYDSKKLNAPNDLVVAKDGSIYFTDPPFGIKPSQKEQPFNGVYRITSGNKVQLLTWEVPQPNGLGFSPDGKELYVNDSKGTDVWVFTVNGDGTLSAGKVFARMKDPGAKQGSADGLKVDSHGNVFTTGPGGVWIFSPGGILLDRISVPEYASNLAWGGDARKTLYITATHSVYSIPVEFKGSR